MHKLAPIAFCGDSSSNSHFFRVHARISEPDLQDLPVFVPEKEIKFDATSLDNYEKNKAANLRAFNQQGR